MRLGSAVLVPNTKTKQNERHGQTRRTFTFSNCSLICGCGVSLFAPTPHQNNNHLKSQNICAHILLKWQSMCSAVYRNDIPTTSHIRVHRHIPNNTRTHSTHSRRVKESSSNISFRAMCGVSVCGSGVGCIFSS